MRYAGDVRAFARLCARIDDPFADRAEVLAAADLSAAQWESTREAWRERWAAGDEEGRALARAFGEEYAAARDGKEPESKRDVEYEVSTSVPNVMAAPAVAPAPPPGVATPPPFTAAAAPPPGVATPPPFAAPPAPLPVAPPPPTHLAPPAPLPVAPPPPIHFAPPAAAAAPKVGAMTAGPALVRKEVLPFQPGVPSTAASAPGAAPSRPAEKRAPSGETADLDIGAIARRILVFGREHARAPPPGHADPEPPRSAAPAPPPAAPAPRPPDDAAAPPSSTAVPGKRFVRFDPQTGQPLAVPYWEDVPAPGKKT